MSSVLSYIPFVNLEGKGKCMYRLRGKQKSVLARNPSLLAEKEIVGSYCVLHG